MQSLGFYLGGRCISLPLCCPFPFFCPPPPTHSLSISLSHAHTRMHACTHTHTRMHTYTHAHTRTHTHAHRVTGSRSVSPTLPTLKTNTRLRVYSPSMPSGLNCGPCLLASTSTTSSSRANWQWQTSLPERGTECCVAASFNKPLCQRGVRSVVWKQVLINLFAREGYGVLCGSKF